MRRVWWDVLGVEPTADERTIRRAYATLLKSTNPEDDAAGFMELRTAYEQGRAFAAHRARYPDGYDDPEDDEAEAFDAAPGQGAPTSAERDLGLGTPEPPPAPFVERRRSLFGEDQPALSGNPFGFGDDLPPSGPARRPEPTAPEPPHDDLDSEAALGILLEQLDRIERSLHPRAAKSAWSTPAQMLEILLNDPLLERVDLRGLVEQELGRMIERNWPRSSVIGARCTAFFGWERAGLGDYRPNVPELYRAEQELEEMFQRALNPVHELAAILKFMRLEPRPRDFFWVLSAIWWSNAAARVLYLDAPGMQDLRRFIPAQYRAVWHQHGAGWRRIRLAASVLLWVLIGLVAVSAMTTPGP